MEKQQSNGLMIKMEKVEEPNVGEGWQCPRCIQDYCDECVEKHEVNFEILDDIEGRHGFHQKPIQWKGLIVCPWCYNQLVIKKTKGGGDSSQH